MTAEIAVMNKLGVALAADSAISVVAGGNTKIYHANKLFTLSKYQPIGIMVYGAGELMDVPWELIIKSYRKELGTTAFKSVEEYGENSITFLNNSGNLFPPQLQEEYVYQTSYSFFVLIKESIDEAVETVIHQAVKISTTQIKQLATYIIEMAGKWVMKLTRPDSMPAGFERKVLARYEVILDQAIDDVFQKLPLSAQLRKELRRITVGLFARDTSEVSGNYAGVVIAGFGTDDIYPALVAYEIEGVLDDTVKYKPGLNLTITGNRAAALIPFAQKEMVISFMEDTSPAYRDTLREYLNKVFTEYPKQVVKKIPRLTRAQRTRLITNLKAEGAKLAEQFWQGVEAWSLDYYVAPVLTTIGVLPLDELASMSESLVNLTSFKRRVSPDAETVGGPIDVAVISRGDGFIWMKRTRYFDPAQNPQFFTRYYT